MTTIWLDGTLVAATDGRVSALDHGFLLGDGVFETLLVVDSTPFALGRHLERLDRSAEALGIDAPDHDTLRAAADAVIAANQTTSGRLRITLTAGPGPLGPTRGDSGPTLMLAVSEIGPSDHGVDVVTVPWPRNERSPLVGVKATSHAENGMALRWARAEGAGEALFANTAGNLCEGSGSNVFVAFDGRLVTPPRSAGLLAGVTRALVLEVTRAAELDVPVDSLVDADEAFLTSSTRGVQGIGSIDGIGLRSCPGPITREAAAAYETLMRTDLDP